MILLALVLLCALPDELRPGTIAPMCGESWTLPRRPPPRPAPPEWEV